MKIIIFWLTIASDVLLVSSLICTLALPRFRAWSPPRQNSWQFSYNWTVLIIAFFGISMLDILDWNSLFINHWLKFPLGVILVIYGLLLAFWGVITVSINDSLGLEGELRTDGLYNYSRNPQYIGDLVLLFGYSLLTNSWMVIITSIGLATWFLLAPFIEEAWLKERYGEKYEKYSNPK